MGRAVAPGALGEAVDARLAQVAIADLVAEGLAHTEGDTLRLGPGAGREAGGSRRLQSAG